MNNRARVAKAKPLTLMASAFPGVVYPTHNPRKDPPQVLQPPLCPVPIYKLDVGGLNTVEMNRPNGSFDEAFFRFGEASTLDVEEGSTLM